MSTLSSHHTPARLGVGFVGSVGVVGVVGEVVALLLGLTLPVHPMPQANAAKTAKRNIALPLKKGRLSTCLKERISLRTMKVQATKRLRNLAAAPKSS